MIEAIIKLLTEVGKFVNIKEEKERAENILDLKRKRNEELAKGQFSDDGVIERIEKDIELEEEALVNQILSKFK